MWHPDSNALPKIRQRIVEKPAAWEKILKSSDFNGVYRLGGDALKRPPRGYSDDTPHIEDIKRKDFIASCSFPVAEAGKSGFPDMAAETFEKAEPLMAFLCAAVGVEF